MVRVALVLSVLALAACDDSPAGAEGMATEEVARSDAEDAPMALPEGHPAVDGALGGKATHALHTGTVRETMSSGGYTYVKLETEQETMWVAGPAVEVVVGDTLTVPDGALMRDFSSPTLGRTFDEILFVEALHTGDISPEAKACHSPDALSEVAEFSTPEGGFAITEIHERSAELAGKQVSLRGQVTKSSHGILGTNWVHLQDGTGSVAGETFDLTVTTANSEVEVGDVILVEGVLATDRDFGAGYRYPVLIEDAKVTVEGRVDVN